MLKLISSARELEDMMWFTYRAASAASAFGGSDNMLMGFFYDSALNISELG